MLALILTLSAGAPLTASAAVVPAPSAPVVRPSTTTGDAYEDAKEAALASYAEALDGFATWCQKNKALAQRNLAYEVLIKIDPDHKLGRKCLKYKLDRKTKEWVRKGKYKAPKAGKPAVVAEAKAKRAEVDATFTAAMLALLETHAKDLGAMGQYNERKALLAMAPDDKALREVHGYVAVEEEGETVWKRKETVRGLAERKKIEDLLETLRSEVPDPEPGKLKKKEDTWGLDWVEPITSGRVRVTALSDLPERERVMRAVHVAYELIPAVIGAKPKVPKDVGIFLLEDETHIPTFVENCKELTANWRSVLTDRHDEYDHVWIRDGKLICYGHTPEYRLDTAIHEVTEAMLTRKYGLMMWDGWALGGFAHYFTELMLGTRITYPAGTWNRGTSTVAETKGDVKDPNADWLAIAHKVVEGRKSFKLENLLAYRVTAMEADDYVLSYSFVRFLCEGHGPEVTQKVLRTFGKRDDNDIAEIVEKAFGAPVEIVERNFEEWLAENVEGAKSERVLTNNR